MASAEDIEQIKVVEWVKQCTSLPVIHIANQRTTSPQHGALLKRMGVRAGTADLFLPRGNGKFSGLWIELKTLTGKPTKLQEEFLIEMIKEGYAAKICYGADHAIQLIKTFHSL